jgi:hypothetical protein
MNDMFGINFHYGLYPLPTDYALSGLIENPGVFDDGLHPSLTDYAPSGLLLLLSANFVLFIFHNEYA